MEGVFELTPPEDSSLLSGSSTLGTTDPSGSGVTTAPDGTVIVGSESQADPNAGAVTPPAPNLCPHNEIFMADPNAHATISAQWGEIQARNQAALAAQAAALAEQGNQ